MTQVLCDPDSPVFAEVEKVRSEWCIRIDGNVKARDPELVNPKIPTGEIEVFIRDMEVLGAADELPLMVFGDQDYPEETRLRYRYLDLRREAMQENMKLRSDVVASIRRRMSSWLKRSRWTVADKGSRRLMVAGSAGRPSASPATSPLCRTANLRSWYAADGGRAMIGSSRRAFGSSCTTSASMSIAKLDESISARRPRGKRRLT